MRITKRNVASKHRLGAGWVVSAYIPSYHTWMESTTLSYVAACLYVRLHRQSWNTRLQTYEGV